MKKLSLLFALWGALVVSLSPVQAQPLSGYCGRETVYNNDSTNLFWQVDTASRVLTITGVGRMKDYSTDTRGPWYPWREKIDRIFIGDEVTTIGTYAMHSLQDVDSIYFGNNLSTIKEYAFTYCTLNRIVLKDNVKQIDRYAFYNCGNLMSIDFGDSPTKIYDQSFAYLPKLKRIKARKITSIDSYAFYNCQQLETLQLGDSVKNIDGHAFYNCNSLKALHIPASTTYIGGSCFTYAYVLDTITVDPVNTVYNSDNDCNAVMQTSSNSLIVGCRRTIIPDNTMQIAYGAFKGCIDLHHLVLPNTMQRIGDDAFSDCSGLQTVVFPNSVISCNCNAFSGCVSLTHPIYNNTLFARLPLSYKGSYTIPNGIQTVCCTAFENCDSITSVIIPNSVKEIGSSAFQYCDKLQSVNLSDSITYIPSYLFYYCHSLQSVTIPDAVTQISSYAFNYCTSLSSLSFPANLTSIDYAIVSGCKNLTNITWNCKDARLAWIFYDKNYEQSILEHIENYHCFYSVRRQITSFTFGDSVQVIPRYLCYGMENLSAVSFGCEVDSIEQHVFEGCNGIKSIHWNARSFKDPYLSVYSPFYPIRDSITTFTFGDSVHHIPAYICNGMSNLHQLVIPAKVSSIGEYAFQHMGTLDSISVNPANTHYDSRGNCNALIETASNHLLLGNYKTRIPADIQGIDACAFRNVRNFTTAIIPEGVSFIGKEAFNGCKDLKNLSLPRKLGAINDYTFQDCDSLYNITLPDSLWFIGLRAFANCTHLQALTLPESTELIDQYAFSGCTGLQAINCNAAVPPSIQQTTFRGSSCPIYVPCPSINDYRTAYIWSDYGSRVVGQFYHTLSARPNDYSFGRVIIQQQPDCEHNAILLAEPAVGHEFVSWQDTLGNVLSADTQFEFQLDKNMSVVAHFIKNIVALKDTEQLIRVRVYNRDILVLSEVNDEVSLFDLTGSKVEATSLLAGNETTLHAPTSGVYIVQTGQQVQKVIVQ